MQRSARVRLAEARRVGEHERLVPCCRGKLSLSLWFSPHSLLTRLAQRNIIALRPKDRSEKHRRGEAGERTRPERPAGSAHGAARRD